MREARLVIGIVGLLAFAYVSFHTLDTLRTALASGRDVSAIQVMQVYSEGIFYGAMALGFVLSGYVLTRTAD